MCLLHYYFFCKFQFSLNYLSIGKEETVKKMSKKPILYMHPVSPPSRAVLMTAAALGIELEQKSVDLLSFEHMKPEFIKVIAFETKRVKIIISVQFFDFNFFSDSNS